MHRNISFSRYTARDEGSFAVFGYLRANLDAEQGSVRCSQIRGSRGIVFFEARPVDRIIVIYNFRLKLEAVLAFLSSSRGVLFMFITRNILMRPENLEGGMN